MYETLKPISFEHANRIFDGGSDKEISQLPMYKDDKQRITIWKCDSFWARLHFLFVGRINLVELGASTMPVLPRTLTIGWPFDE